MRKNRVALIVAFGIFGSSFLSLTFAADPLPVPATPTFSTIAFTQLAIEGLTADQNGNLYTTGRAAAGTPCPVYKIVPQGSSLVTPVVVGNVPNNFASPCNPSGAAFDKTGFLYIADANPDPVFGGVGGVIWKLSPNEAAPPTATQFATGVPGTNGLAFDKNGNLWTGDGTTGQGRVWKITPGGIVTEMFRIQPMRNGSDLGGDLGGRGVGRENRTVPVENAQNLVANGLAFEPTRGRLLVADTARGAIWRVEFEKDGSVESRKGCDTTFTPNTLCLENIFVSHPLLEGVDGIALDVEGNIWAAANERNAIVFVSADGRVVEVFRNDPDGTTLLRNTGPMEFPTSPVVFGNVLYTSHSNGNRRDNSPPGPGEIPAQGAGKISRLDQNIQIPGLPLPVN